MTSLNFIRLVRLPATALLIATFAIHGAGVRANEIEVCKVSDTTSPVPAGTMYNFTIDGTIPFSLAVGGDCAFFPDIGAGPHVVTEAAQAGSAVSSITVTPPERLDSLDLSLGTVTVEAVDDPTFTVVTYANAAQTQPLTQGCTPGFWKQSFHFSLWTGLTPTQTVDTVFTGVDASLSGETLLQALQGGGGPGLVGAEEILLRAAVAAMLNAGNSSIAFQFTSADIVSAVNAALATGDRNSILTLATTLDNANNGVGGCPLS